ncbi:hypothetical protein [Amycolatopsis sp. DG1A-15b]|uniref:hypothetical protein n=1 Tax=Amycolatopsis sp. DG1A-15b TaxID=3052846 RepID=UPI00255C0CB0|nr:hypothetical protein [Amycolatopsis sp. DG1A-15b]WIX84757.1 hypothetical protein QRY02_26290 [Amycolatopsis sp. DG1A-15b]
MSQFLLVGTAEIRVGCRVHRKSRFVMPNKTFPAGHQSSPMSGYTAFCHRVRALLGHVWAGFCRTVVVLRQHPADVAAWFQELTRQAGLPSIRLHDLRHRVRSHGRAAPERARAAEATAKIIPRTA